MTGSDESSSVLLQGDTLQIGFHGVGKAPYPEDIVAPGALRAIAQHLKLDLQTDGVFWGDYCYFAGVTGEAFRFLDFMDLVKDDTGRPLVERYGNTATVGMYGHAFDAAGLEAEIYRKPNLPGKASLQRLIMESLPAHQQGPPALFQ